MNSGPSPQGLSGRRLSHPATTLRRSKSGRGITRPWPRSGGPGVSRNSAQRGERTKARDGARGQGNCPSPDEYFRQLYCQALRIGWWKREEFVHAVMVTGHDANTLQILQMAVAEAGEEA